MPQLTPDQEDSIFEAISKQLFRINQVVKGMFGQDMTDEELRHAHQRVSQGVNQAMQQMEQKKNYTPLGGEPSLPAVPPAATAEGGLINDQSGAATALIRKQQGIQ